MTSNICSDLINQDKSLGFSTKIQEDEEEQATYKRVKANVLDEIKKFFRPEFLNRIDGTVVFHALSKSHMKEIVDLMLNEVSAGLFEKAITLEVTDKAKEWLADKGYDPHFGARPLRRMIQDHVEDKLSDAVLAGEFNPGDTAVVDLNNDEIQVTSESPLPVAPKQKT